MTGRRAISGWDQRLSRALQFNPGHVGGRVASAQPIQRTGGTLRRPSIGTATSIPTVVSDSRGGGTSTSVSTGVLDAAWASGDITVMIVTATGGFTIGTVPATWNEVTRGSSGGTLNWALYWAAGDPWDFDSIPLSGSGYWYQRSYIMRNVGAKRPTLSGTQTATAATGINFAPCAGVGNFQVVGWDPGIGQEPAISSFAAAFTLSNTSLAREFGSGMLTSTWKLMVCGTYPTSWPGSYEAADPNYSSSDTVATVGGETGDWMSAGVLWA